MKNKIQLPSKTIEPKTKYNINNTNYVNNVSN